MFALLAVPLAAYTLYAAATGEIWVAQGARARRVSRHESPLYFWACVAVYAVLAVAMATIF